MRLLPYQDTTQLLHARTLDDYGIMALALDLESGSTKNGCVGCRKIKEEELRKKSALRNSMVDSLVEKPQSICKSLILTVFIFSGFKLFLFCLSIVDHYRLSNAACSKQKQEQMQTNQTATLPPISIPAQPANPTQIHIYPGFLEYCGFCSLLCGSCFVVSPWMLFFFGTRIM